MTKYIVKHSNRIAKHENKIVVANINTDGAISVEYDDGPEGVCVGGCLISVLTELPDICTDTGDRIVTDTGDYITFVIKEQG